MPTISSLRVVSTALLLSALSAASAHEGSGYVEALQESLVAYAASDFAASDSRPEGFRKVDLRYRENDQGARTYLLCGEAHLRAGDKGEWVPFATLKTMPYEQWLGGTASDLCARAVPVLPEISDLSAALQAKLADSAPTGKP